MGTCGVSGLVVVGYRALARILVVGHDRAKKNQNNIAAHARLTGIIFMISSMESLQV